MWLYVIQHISENQERTPYGCFKNLTSICENGFRAFFSRLVFFKLLNNHVSYRFEWGLVRKVSWPHVTSGGSRFCPISGSLAIRQKPIFQTHLRQKIFCVRFVKVDAMRENEDNHVIYRTMGDLGAFFADLASSQQKIDFASEKPTCSKIEAPSSLRSSA